MDKYRKIVRAVGRVRVAREKIEHNNEKIDELEDINNIFDVDEQEAFNEISINIDRKSNKEWNKNVRKISKDTKNLVNQNKKLERKNNKDSKTIERQKSKVLNPLIAKRLRLVQQMKNLETELDNIKAEMETIKTQILEAKTISKKNEIRNQLKQKQKRYTQIMKKIGDVQIKLDKANDKLLMLKNQLSDDVVNIDNMIYQKQIEMFGEPNKGKEQPNPEKPEPQKPEPQKPEPQKQNPQRKKKEGRKLTPEEEADKKLFDELQEEQERHTEEIELDKSDNDEIIINPNEIEKIEKPKYEIKLDEDEPKKQTRWQKVKETFKNIGKAVKLQFNKLLKKSNTLLLGTAKKLENKLNDNEKKINGKIVQPEDVKTKMDSFMDRIVVDDKTVSRMDKVVEEMNQRNENKKKSYKNVLSYKGNDKEN